MEIIEFAVQGSAAEPYVVTFSRTGESFTAFCTCPAGQSRQSCKHRIGILAGSTKGLVSGTPEQVGLVANWLPGSHVAVDRQALVASEAAFEQAKKAVSAARAALAAALHAAP
ncbi:hypothetical protein GGR60_002628 [Xanthomonas arboricola]|uniref:hypothetical protein n=1 Tax=Xanthomonas euroxanthea TaxID=2259622 RepID=UPI00142FFD2C|nr:hypothetical protein [Xanthomonas euroxanthea]NJC38074.1 hypothetical protein [Xanthomonas euroxanthea]